MSSKGEDTRARILREALRQVSTVGFEGLTFGPLAQELGLSKSGLFAHFGSREELQLATLQLAAYEFRRDVLEAALDQPRGLPRLMTILRNWFARYPEGGCVFLSGSAEYDDRPGEMRQAICQLHQEWRESLATALRQCQETGDLDRVRDCDQIAFEIFALTAVRAPRPSPVPQSRDRKTPEKGGGAATTSVRSPIRASAMARS